HGPKTHNRKDIGSINNKFILSNGKSGRNGIYSKNKVCRFYKNEHEEKRCKIKLIVFGKSKLSTVIASGYSEKFPYKPNNRIVFRIYFFVFIALEHFNS